MCLLAGFVLWLAWPLKHEQVSRVAGITTKAPVLKQARFAKKSLTLERIRTTAQRRLPQVRFEGKEDVAFAEIDASINELDVFEVLLEIEAEFGVDIPQAAINQLVGVENRRDLRSHLSLLLIAECVDEILQDSER
jgi:acyl carrier protein